MNSKKSLLGNLSEEQKNFIKILDNKGLEKIFQSRKEALKYAKQGILQSEPEKLKNDYIELIADSMQILARIVLEERGILRKS